MPLWGIPYSLPRTCARAGRQRSDPEGEIQKRPFHSRKGRLLDFVTLGGLLFFPQSHNP